MTPTPLACCLKIALAGLLIVGLSAPASAQAFRKDAWLEDLAQVRQAFSTRYANLEWAQLDNANRLSDLLDRTRDRIEHATDDGDARAAFDTLERRLGDGHVMFYWPSSTNPASVLSTPCRNYDASRAATPIMPNAPGYVPLPTTQSDTFPTGLLTVDGQKIGVIEVGLIGAGASPELCLQALAALDLSPAGPCDESCLDRIDRWTNDRYTELFAARISALKAAGATALLLDLAGNGGGNEWADAAARMVTARRLTSERMAFVRGGQWTTNLLALEATLRRDAAAATGSDRAMLLGFADQAHAKARIAATPCDPGLLWRNQTPRCAWLGAGFYATGPLASADPKALRGKAWARDVFTPLEFPYEEGVWSGPVMVLIDGTTESSAEEFAAVLQDNHAALIIGTVTFGAGCGHTDGSEPTTLRHSGGTLSLPDCVYLRADGSNEVRGVVPDLLVGFRRADNLNHRAADVLAELPWAMREAAALNRRP